MLQWLQESSSPTATIFTSRLLLMVCLSTSENFMAMACLPRLGPASSGKPLFWNLFGQRGNSDSDDAEPQYDEETKSKSAWNTIEWIERNNYAFEKHNVTTRDGYQLQLHRIPKPGYRPVLLIHGLLTSSLAWVLMGPTKSLAFVLFDKAYDVWLANLRGCAYGRNHTHLNTTDPEFWSFSFHEHGIFDLPAIIDHVRRETSFHQVILITHSQGFNAVLVLCSVQPEFNEKILLVQALAPPVELRNYVKFDSEDVRRLRKWIKGKTQSSSYEAFPTSLVQSSCLKARSEKRRECAKQMRTFAGSANWSRSINPLVYGQLLQGGSFKELLHLTQLWKSGDFVAYDYDATDNQQHYNTVEPLIYNLQHVTVPIVLHFGQTDALASPEGVHHIYSHILQSVIGVYRVAADKFNHLDFILSDHIRILVNDKLIEIMEKFFAGTLKYAID